jgi:transcription initiation factor TFIIIB Brf1 subunit/transcription initiation factor TFIIB
MNDKCPNCGSKHIMVDRGYPTCQKCGLVVNDLPRMETSFYTKESPLPTNIRRRQKINITYRRINRLIRREKRISKDERNALSTDSMLSNTIEKLNLKPLKKQIRESYKRAVRQGLARRCTNERLLGAIIYTVAASYRDSRFFRFPDEIAEIFMKRLFSWDKVPESDGERLRGFLRKRFGIDWVENADFSKTENGKSIIVSDGENSVIIALNGRNNKISIKIKERDNKVSIKAYMMAYSFLVREEDGKLTVYEREKVRHLNRAIKLVKKVMKIKVNLPTQCHEHERIFHKVLGTLKKEKTIDREVEQLAMNIFKNSAAPLRSYKSAKARAAAAIYEAAKFYGIRVKEQELAKVLEINRGMIIRERKKL